MKVSTSSRISRSLRTLPSWEASIKRSSNAKRVFSVLNQERELKSHPFEDEINVFKNYVIILGMHSSRSGDSTFCCCWPVRCLCSIFRSRITWKKPVNENKKKYVTGTMCNRRDSRSTPRAFKNGRKLSLNQHQSGWIWLNRLSKWLLFFFATLLKL